MKMTETLPPKVAVVSQAKSIVIFDQPSRAIGAIRATW